MKLKNKVALVTGSSAGIGAGIARGLAAAGADVIVNYRRDENGAHQTQKEIEAMGRRTRVIRADVGLKEDVDRMFDEIQRGFDRLDILINNAGQAVKRPFASVDEALWDRLFATNLKSVFLCSQRAIPLMPPGGVILNISSIHAWSSTHNFSVYAATKGGMESLTRGLAIEYGEKGIRVNALRVGWVVTAREPFGPDHPSYSAVCARMPIGRVGQIEDIVPTAVHLCSEDAAFITGQAIGIDGGATIQLNTPFPKGFVDSGAWQAWRE